MSYRLKVKQGNLLNENNATFIVNASNTRLLLGSGVSMAFKHHCGNTLQEEMNDSLCRIGKTLVQGDVIATSSGKAINFKYALHTAIMNYNPGTKYDKKNPTLDTINLSLENIEQYLIWYAKKKQEHMKLALPLLGCGVGGLNKVDVISIYKEFFNRIVNFDCDVIIYGYDECDYTFIKSLL